jgi:hypothetical protein
MSLPLLDRSSGTLLFQPCNLMVTCELINNQCVEAQAVRQPLAEIDGLLEVL